MRSGPCIAVSALLALSVTSCRKAENSTQPTSIKSHILYMLGASPQESQIVPLYMSKRRMLVMLRVGHSAPVSVVFDTGTNENLLDLGLANSLHLPQIGQSTAVDGSTGKPVPGYDTFLRSASLSGVPIQDGPAVAVAYDQGDEIGIFGPNSFPGKLVRLESTENRLSILPILPENQPSCTPYRYLGVEDDALPSADIEVGDLKIPAILDTGNDSPIILSLDYIAKLPLEKAPVRIGYAYSAAGRQPLLSGRLNGTMKIGPKNLEHPEIHFMKGGRPNIGFPILRELTIIMDPTGHRDWVLSPADAHDACSSRQ